MTKPKFADGEKHRGRMGKLVRIEDADSVFPVPALITKGRDRASWRFVEFFTVNIR